MKYTELKEDEIYFVNWLNSTSYVYIFRATKDLNNCRYIELNHRSYSKVGAFNISENKYREATPQEIEHFLQCEKAGKYVEYKPELIDYQVY